MYLLDSNVIIDFCNAKLPLNAKNILINSTPALSVISNIEIFASDKIPESEILLLKQFVNAVTIFDVINAKIGAKTISIRQKNKIKLPDAIIAATALEYNLILMTRNVDGFKGVEGITVINPYSL